MTRAGPFIATSAAAVFLLGCQIVFGPTPMPPPAVAPTFTPRPGADDGRTPSVPGVKNFVCPLRREAEVEFGYGIQTNWAVGDIGFWNTAVRSKLGLNWVKGQVRWRDFESAPGVYDSGKFEALDAFVWDANYRGLNLLLTIVDAPFFLRSAHDPQHPDRLGPPDDYAEAARFFGQALQRYQGCVQAIEIWNETNLGREWTTPGGIAAGHPDAAEYARFLSVVVPRLRSIDPKVILIAGGLSPTGANGPESRDDIVYLGELAAAGGLDQVDCVGAHLNGFNMPPDKRFNEGYNDPTARFRGPFENPHHSWSFRSTLEAYADKSAKPICVTEFGWPSMENLGAPGAPPGFGFALDNTEQEQAGWIALGFEVMRATGRVRMGIVFNLDYIVKSGGSPASDSSMPYSLLRKDGVPRPAFDALERMPKRP